jgi:hypothetical protein
MLSSSVSKTVINHSTVSNLILAGISHRQQELLGIWQVMLCTKQIIAMQ